MFYIQAVLRTPETIRKLSLLVTEPGSPSPIQEYFTSVLREGKLNEDESLKLAEQLVNQRRIPLLEMWLEEGKVCSMPTQYCDGD